MKVNKHNLTYLLSIIWVLLVDQSYTRKLNPVILIPGDGGSQMEAKINKTNTVHYVCEKSSKDYFTIWLNMELLIPVVIDCWVDNVKLIYDNRTRTTRNNDGVITRIPGFGGTETVEWLDPSHSSTGNYFNTIADTLVSLGHVRNETIKGAPYDFRKAPNENQEYFVKLKELVENTYVENKNTPVVLLAHSLGGCMALHFLHLQTQQWKDKYINSMVTLAGAWGGSMKALKVYAIGDDLGSRVLSENVLRREQITSPSLAYLLPSKLFWKHDEVLIQTESKNFSLGNLRDYFQSIDFMDGWEMRQDTEHYQLNFTPPGVEVHCLYGIGVPTVERLYYKPGSWFSNYPTLINGDGDGTVNRRSLEGCSLWRPLQKQKVYYKAIPNAEHLQILKNQDVLEYLKELFE